MACHPKPAGRVIKPAFVSKRQETTADSLRMSRDFPTHPFY